MATIKDTKLTKSKHNGKIAISEKHETDELKIIEKIAGFEQLDPEEMSFVEYTEKTFSNVCIVPMFDLHIGGEGTKLERLKLVIEFVKRTPNAVVILGGDILDNATLLGATNAHTSKLNPDRALDLAVKLLESIKHKILLVTAGNHDGASGSRNKDSNMAPAKQLAKRLGVKYCPFNAMVRIKLPLKNAKRNKRETINYNVFVTHGSGNAGSKASTVDTALTKALKACGRYDILPDLILTGHFHADANGLFNLSVTHYDDFGKVIGIMQKSVRVESLSTMQEANTYAVANNMEITTANIPAINICWLKNPYYNESSKTWEYEFSGQSTKFPILQHGKNDYSRIALEYMQHYKENEHLEEDLRRQCETKSIDEIVEEIEY